VAMLHVPYQADGRIEPSMVRYVVDQLKTEVIPKLEKVTGRPLDADLLRGLLARSAVAEEDFVYVLESAKNRPSPIDAYFGGVYYIGPLFTAFRGTEAAVDYYRMLRAEVEGRLRLGQGPITPEGLMGEQVFRMVVEGPPNWTHFREFWRMFHEEGAVVVASTYTKVGGLYDKGFRHDPDRPLETLAEYCLGCYTNLNLPTRVDMIAKYVVDYEADGFLMNSVKSCNSFSAGQLVMLREVEDRTGVAGGFIETDLVDPRYFSASNVKNRLESYFQMLAQRKQGAQEVAPA
jgi:benzoyl-CoA reductase subunit B